MKMEGYNIENLSIYITNKGYRRFDDLKGQRICGKSSRINKKRQ